MRTKIEEYVLSVRSGDIGSGIDHFKRVYRVACELGEENYDDNALYAACLLHDISTEEPHEKNSAIEAIQFLRKIDFPEDKIAIVADAIPNHGFDGRPQTYEGKLLHDSDAIDLLGSIGIVRYAAMLNRKFQKIDIESLIKILRERIKEIPKILLLSQAKSIVKSKITTAKKIINFLEKENI